MHLTYHNQEKISLLPTVDYFQSCIFGSKYKWEWNSSSFLILIPFNDGKIDRKKLCTKGWSVRNTRNRFVKKTRWTIELHNRSSLINYFLNYLKEIAIYNVVMLV